MSISAGLGVSSGDAVMSGATSALRTTESSGSVSVSKDSVDVSSTKLSMTGSMIGMGRDSSTSEYDFRLQASPSPTGEDTSLIVASAPIQATLVQYSSDKRIKKEIKDVDEEAFSRRFSN